MPYDWPANFIRAIDGDTIEVELDRGFHDRSIKRLRLAGIDTPELRDKDDEVRKRAALARDFVEETLGIYRSGFGLNVHTLKTRKGDERRTFGRYVATVLLPTTPTGNEAHRDLCALLVAKGHAIVSR